MARFKIYSKDGNTIRYEGAPTYHGTYLNPSYLEFSTISSPVPIAWEIGDYVEYTRTGLKYELYSIPQPTKKATRDKSGESFVYSNVQLYDFTKMLDIAPFRDLVLNGTTYYFSSTKDFSTYENLEGIANRIKRNMNDFAGSDLWDVKVAEGLESLGIGTEDPKEFSVSGVTCLGALTHIYEVWDTIGWSYSIENGKYVITIGAPNIKGSGNTTNKYQYGYGNGLTAIRKTQTNISEMVTRLFVYGSTKNMIEDYYRGLDIYQKESVNIPNLMLPTTSWGKTDNLPDASKAYLEDASAKGKYGLIPKTIYFDGSDEEEIYPTIEGATIGDVKTAKQSIGSTEYVPTGVDNTQRVDVVAEVTSQPEDAGITGTDGSKYVESADITSQVVIKDHVVATRSDTAISDTFTFASHTFSNSGRMRVEMGKGSDEVFVVMVRGGIDPTKYSIKVRFGAFCGDTQVASYREAKLTKTTSVSEGFAFYYSMSAFPAGTSNIAVTGKVDFKVEIVFTVLEFAEYQLRFASQESHFSAGMENILTGTFGIRIRQVGFDVMKRAALAGQSNPSITFNSGKLAGRTFTIASSVYDSTSDTWVLSINRAKDDSTNMTYPNTNYPVAVDDRFVFTDIAMPEEYIAMASARLLAMGQKYLEDNCVAMPFYEPSIDSKKVWENIQANPGQEQYILREGKYMHIKDADMTDGDEYVIIDSLTINEGESNIPTYSATLRDEKVRTLVQTLNSKINRLGNKGGVSRVTQNVELMESASRVTMNGVLMEGNMEIEDVGGASQESLDKVEDNVGTSVAIYDAESKRFVLSGVSLNPRSLTNCRYVFKMDKAVTELPESRSSAILSIGGFVNGIKWRGKNATPSNTWEEGAWVDAWYYDGSWYMTYANTRVSYEIWGEETIIVKPTN